MKAEVVFTLFVILIFGFQVAVDKNLKWVGQLVSFDAIQVTPSNYDKEVVDKKIVVLGNDLSIYKNATLATPYLNWGVFKNPSGKS